MVSLLSAETLPVAVATQSKAATAVYIGVPACEQETATAWAASPYISKIGGPPASFDGTTINSGKCRYCDAPLCLVAQIYAPLDFPRSVLIFGCNQTKCTHHKSPGAWRVVRLQDSRDTNPWGVNTPQMGQRCNNSALAACSIPTSVTSTEEEDEDWDALLATRDAVIASRAASTPTTNGGFGGNAREVPSLRQHAAFSPHAQLAPILLDVMDEPGPDADAAARHVLQKYKHLVVDPVHGYTFGEKGDDAEQPKFSSRRSLSESSFDTAKIDEETVDFQIRLLRAPRQCIRYGYGTVPLWPCRPPTEFDVPQCARCGGERHFELQLTPALLSFADFADVVDWSTILIYSCERSCDVEGQCSEEYVYVVATPWI